MLFFMALLALARCTLAGIHLASQSQAQIPLSSKRQKHNVYRYTTPYRDVEREYPYVSTALSEPLTHYSHIIVNSVANY